MRLVLAIVSFFLAAVMIGFGIAQRTILEGPDHVTASVTTSSPATVTVIDGAVLNSFDHSQTIKASGADTIFAAYGRTDDVIAWVGDATYNKIGYDATTQKLTTTTVSGAETEVPNPAGSDLWLSDYTEDRSLGFTINVPEDVSVLIVSDGEKPAPSALSVTWLLDNSTPWAVPLVIGGTMLLLLGLIFLLWAINHMRRARGPRRKQLRMPKVPRPPAYKAVKRGAPAPKAVTRGRRSAGMIAVIPALLVGTLALGGCTADPTTSLENGTAIDVAATSAPTDASGKPLATPAVTEPQAKRIVSRVAAAVADADKSSDAKKVATRLDGPALALRLANYKIRTVDTTTAALAAIPSSPVALVLPQQNDSWPRTFFAVIQPVDETVAPTALMLIQDDPRSQYKVHYALQLEPGTVIPKVAKASVGSFGIDEDSKLLLLPASQIAEAYGDILHVDKASKWYDYFQAEGDTLRVEVGPAEQAADQAKLPGTAQLVFSNKPADAQIVALTTNNSGAIVALSLNELQTISPVESGAAVNAPPAIAALLGKALSTRGITATYGDQLLFYVPPATDKGGKIILLGYTQGPISAAEL